MDPIADMLIMLKNASIARKESVIISYSNLKQAIIDCLVKQGFVESTEKKNQKGFPQIEIGLKYENDKPKIKGVKRISKLSRRIYIGSQDIKPVKQGYGIVVLSTPKGIMAGKEARKELVGGEVLFEIW